MQTLLNMFNEDIDLEDIEARLYSQVYHSTVDADIVENVPTSSTLTTKVSVELPRQVSQYSVSNMPAAKFNKRYFEKDHYLPLSSTSTENMPMDNNYNSQYQNNVTVNQFTMLNPPYMLNAHNITRFSTPNNSQGNRNWQMDNNSSGTKAARKARKLLNRQLKRREKKEKKRQLQLLLEAEDKKNKQAQKRKSPKITAVAKDVICLSDSDDGEKSKEPVKEVEPAGDKTKTKSNETDKELSTKSPSDEDDIVFIEPPPIEVINLDPDPEMQIEKELDNTSMQKSLGESSQLNLSTTSTDCSPNIHPESNIISKERKELLSTPESTSNDFLDNTIIELHQIQFNFGLHGSDFNNDEFVRPANPTDIYETESSCSTTDMNKDLNSLKTVVFSEIDFPKEDLFSENNLESFGNYITPKRTNKSSKKTTTVKGNPETSKRNLQNANNVTSSGSSSESEYELQLESTPQNKILKNTAGSGKNLPNLSPMQSEVERNTNASPNVSVETATTKNSLINCLVRSKKKELFNKRKSDQMSNKSVSEDEGRKKSKGKKKRRDSLGNESLSDKNESIDANNKKKKKKNAMLSKDNGNVALSKSGDSNECSINTDTDKEVIQEQPRKRKKKKNSSSCSSSPKPSESSHIDDEYFEKTKNPSNVNQELTPTTNPELSDSSSKRKKKKSWSISTNENLPLLQDNFQEQEKNKADASRMDFIEERVFSNPKASINEKIVENCPGKEDQSKMNKGTMKTTCSIALNDANELPKEIVPMVEKLSQQIVKPNEQPLTPKNKSSIEDINSKNLLNSTESNADDSLILIETDTVATEHKIENKAVDPKQNDEVIILDDTCNNDLVIVDEDVINTTMDIFEMEGLQVIDEVAGSDVEELNLVVSSGSEYDFNTLDDVGKDLQLANCSIVSSKKDYSNFDVENIQKSMSDNPNDWKVITRDRLNFNYEPVQRGPRCNKCRQLGHMALRCPNKTELICLLCGGTGHTEPRCPNKLCTQCGNAGDYSTTFCHKCIKYRNRMCNLCLMYGHTNDICPDLWRRYHLTTEEGPLNVLKEPQIKPQKELWCSGCAKSGHLEHNCNYYNRVYPPSDPRVHSYNDVYGLVPHQNSNQPTRNILVSPASSSGNNSSNLVIQVPNPNFNSNLVGNERGPVVKSFSFLTQFDTAAPSLENNFSNSNNSNFIPPLIPQLQFVLNSSSPQQNFGNATNLIPPLFPMNPQRKQSFMNASALQQTDIRTNLPHVKTLPGENKDVRYKNIIMNHPIPDIQVFISDEISKLDHIMNDINPRQMRKKLIHLSRVTKGTAARLSRRLQNEMFFLNRTMNMFVFGVHKFRDGKRHLDFLKNFLTLSPNHTITSAKRASLLSAYIYLYGSEQHVGENYSKYLQLIISRPPYNSL